MGERGRRNLTLDSRSPYLARLSRRIGDAVGTGRCLGQPELGDVDRLLLALAQHSGTAGAVDERQLAAEAGLLTPSAAADPVSYFGKRPRVLRALGEMESRGWAVVDDAGPGWARVRPTPRGLRYVAEFWGPAVGGGASRRPRGRLPAVMLSLSAGVATLVASLRRLFPS